MLVGSPHCYACFLGCLVVGDCSFVVVWLITYSFAELTLVVCLVFAFCFLFVSGAGFGLWYLVYMIVLFGGFAVLVLGGCSLRGLVDLRWLAVSFVVGYCGYAFGLLFVNAVAAGCVV